MGNFTGWDIYVKTNPKILEPLSISIAGNLFSSNFTGITLVPVASCIDGINGPGCPGKYAPGTAESAAAILGTPPSLNPPIYGLLFAITYNVTSSVGQTAIQISSATLTNGLNVTGVPLTTQDGSYGSSTSPDFLINVNPNALTIPQGTNATTKVTLYSALPFANPVNLVAVGNFSSIFGQQSFLLPGGSVSTNLTLTASKSLPSTFYTVTVNASSGVIWHTATISVTVQTGPDFLVGLSPALVRLPAGTTGNTTIFVQGENHFSGTVSLTVRVPANVTYVLGSSSLNVQPNQNLAQTLLNFTTPVVSQPFVYQVNITASSGSLQHNQTLVVTFPLAGLAVTVNPGNITLQQGRTASSKITLWSVNYFFGFEYCSAVMSGGTASFDLNTYYVPVPNSKYSPITPSGNFTISITVPPDAIPGNYIVLVTAYSVQTTKYVLPSSFQIDWIKPITRQFAIPVHIQRSSILPAAPKPVTILGLTPLEYFAALGVLTVPLVVLSIRIYRTRREEQEEDADWRA